MPSWKIHNKWARIFGIDEKVSNYVNEMIDFPKRFANRHPEFKEFLKHFTGISGGILIEAQSGMMKLVEENSLYLHNLDS